MVDLQESIGSIILLVIGVGVSILVLIFVSVLGGGVFTNAEPNINVISNNVTDSPLNFSFNVNTLPYSHDTSNDIYKESDVLVAWNGTGTFGTLVRNTNYTVTSYPAGQFSITDLGDLNYSYVYVNVSYATGNPIIEESIVTAIQQSFVALNTTGSYLPIIVLAVIVFIILSLIMALNLGTRGYKAEGMAL